MSTPKQMQKKYQAIRLYNSGLISLNDIKATFRIVAVVADDEYTSEGTARDVLGTRDRFKKLERLTQTRNAAIQEKILRFKTKPKLTNTRDEQIAKFATDYKAGIPINWDRYGILRKRTKRVNKPRPGSSKGKIAKPLYRGFKEFNRDFDRMEKELLKLFKDRSAKTSINKTLSKVRDSAKVTTARG